MTNEPSSELIADIAKEERDSAQESPTVVNAPPSSESEPHDMAKRKAKGFSQFRKSVERDVLFGTASDLPRIVELSVAEIRPNPDQPRKTFNQEKLEELAASIRENGLIQPITVARDKNAEDGTTYIVVAGERRLRAHQILERETIAAIITEGERDVIALIENIQREGLDPLEEADAYQQMMERHGYSQTELGRIVGKKQNTISEALALTRLSDAVVVQYRTSDIPLSKNVLVEIAKASSPEDQLALIEEAQEFKLGVRAVRARRKAPSPSRDADGARSSETVAASQRKDRLIRSLAVAVKRAQEDARIEDFPAGSNALERLRELKHTLDETLDAITKQ
ncbi:MAG: ParB/RepB/Spo0J family partition protein [Bacteroidota bacterium]